MNQQTLTMSTENPLSGFMSPRNLPLGYFRSKIFVASSSANPLIAAAGPVISLLERICVSTTLPSIDVLRDNMYHEMMAFLSRINTLQYAREMIAVSYYLLAATVDEILGKNLLRVFHRDIPFEAFTPPSVLGDEEGPQEHFFTIVTYIKQHPESYINIIELAYYCLITGFEGIYHTRTDGRMQLDNYIEELYHLVHENKVFKPKRLFKPALPTQVNTHKKQWFFWFLCCGIAAGTSLGLFTSYWLLNNKAQTIQYHHDILNTLDN